MSDFATLNENNNLSKQFTPLHIENAQSASPCSLITAHEVGVLNVQRCKENLDSYQSQFKSLLEDYKKNYVLYNSMPSNNEYASIFFSDKSGLDGLNSKLAKTTSDIQQNIVAINGQVEQLNKGIAEEKSKEADLSRRVAMYTGQIILRKP
jgi:hypothetical protein